MAILAGLGVWAFWIEPASLRLTDFELPLRAAPAPLAGLRIAVVSDLHAGAPFMNLAKFVRVVALIDAARPDLILIAGDIFVEDVIGGRPLAPQAVAGALAGLHAPLGVFAVLGNHDEGELAPLYLRCLQSAGIVPLANDLRKIQVGGGTHFWLAGFDDLSTRRLAVKATLARVDDDAPVIGLTHNPQLFRYIPARVNLLIAGHTHGGQVRLPLLSHGILTRFTRRYLAGHYRDQTDLFVTTGIGTTDLPVRFRVAPEIALLHLRQDSDAGDAQ